MVVNFLDFLDCSGDIDREEDVPSSCRPLPFFFFGLLTCGVAVKCSCFLFNLFVMCCICSCSSSITLSFSSFISLCLRNSLSRLSILLSSVFVLGFESDLLADDAAAENDEWLGLEMIL